MLEACRSCAVPRRFPGQSTAQHSITINLLRIFQCHFLGVNLLLLLHSLAAHALYLPKPLPLDDTIM